MGYTVSVTLLLYGGYSLMMSHQVSWWYGLSFVLLISPLAVALSLMGGSFILPPPHPNALFEPQHPAHAGCCSVDIADGEQSMPGYFLKPIKPNGGAVCIVPGAGDNKIGFKWRLVRSLLAAGLHVLVIDPPGHGDYRHTPMRYPDCLSAIGAALNFLHEQPHLQRVGLIGISLGGALSLKALSQAETEANVDSTPIELDALVIIATTNHLVFNQRLLYREIWHAFRAPVLSLLQEISVLQLRQSWLAGGFRSHHSLADLFRLFDPVTSLSSLPTAWPTLLVYGERDVIAPPSMGQTMQQHHAQAELWIIKKASHVTLTLIETATEAIAKWLAEKLSADGGSSNEPPR